MFVSKILDFLFPPFCVNCQKSGSWWCDDCQQKVEFVRGDICAKCLKIGKHDKCGILPFDKVIAVGYYHDSVLREVITKLKFQGVFVLQNTLVDFLQKWTISNDDYKLLQTVDAIIPMPLTKKRWRERGFNQSLILAKIFKNRLNLLAPIVDNLLVRDNIDFAQSELEHNLDCRVLNVKGSFLSYEHDFNTILLIDDVITTGATAREAARVLINKGAKKIIVLTLAIGT